MAGNINSPPVGSPERAALEERIGAELEQVAEADIHELRVRWRKLFRKTAPAHLTRALLLRIIAYRIQANAFGDLDRDTVKFLDRVAAEIRKGNKAAVPAVPDPRTGKLKPGTVLVREHGGEMHRVRVMAEGFAWNGTTYRSLSEVARAITGTNWNGPRFFGLRDWMPATKGGGAVMPTAEARS